MHTHMHTHTQTLTHTLMHAHTQILIQIHLSTDEQICPYAIRIRIKHMERNFFFTKKFIIFSKDQVSKMFVMK